MIRLIYCSYATIALNEDQLVALLESARDKNKRLEITGVLFYVDEAFIQILEGAQKEVEDLYNKIKVDERHEDVRIIDKKKITSRIFNDWSMGFCTLENYKTKDLKGFNKFLYKKTDAESFQDLSNSINNLLKTYQEYCVQKL